MIPEPAPIGYERLEKEFVPIAGNVPFGQGELAARAASVLTATSGTWLVWNFMVRFSSNVGLPDSFGLYLSNVPMWDPQTFAFFPHDYSHITLLLAYDQGIVPFVWVPIFYRQTSPVCRPVVLKDFHLWAWKFQLPIAGTVDYAMLAKRLD